jgi:hypothetical protein
MSKHVCRVHQAMCQAGIDRPIRRQWRDRQFARIDQRLSAMRRAGESVAGYAFVVNAPDMIASHAESGELEKVRDRLERLMAIEPRWHWLGPGKARALRDAAGKLKDPKLLAKLEAWLPPRPRPGRPTGLKLLTVNWPAAATFRAKRPPAPVRALKVDVPDDWTTKVVRVIGIAGGGLYVVPDAGYIRFYPPEHRFSRNNPRLASLAVDDQGRPTTGELTVLPPFQVSEETDVHAANIIGGKLCLATSRSGLLLYDPAAGSWAFCGAKHGLPYQNVGGLLSLGGPMTLCAGARVDHCALYTVDVSKLEVVLHRKAPRMESPFAAWRHSGRWITAHRTGVVRGALADRGRLEPWLATPQGWPRDRIAPATAGSGGWGKLAMAVVGGRRFVGLHDGLREIDDAGRTLRVWPTDYLLRYWVRELQLFNTFADCHRIHVAAEVPEGTLIGTDGSRLFFASGCGLACLDVAKDTWYGPLAVKAFSIRQYPSGYVAADRVWLDNTKFQYVLTSEFLAAARQAGQVATTAELRDRLAKTIAAAPPLDRAKYAFSRRRLDRAASILAELLQREPANGEAALLLGLLHDPHYRNQPERAAECYRQAARSHRPDVAATAMYRHCQLLLRLKRKRQALHVGQSMLERFRLANEPRGNVQRAVRKLQASQSPASRPAPRKVQRQAQRQSAASPE